MKRWTIAEPFRGCTHIRINTGGPSMYCDFDFAVSPVLSGSEVEIALGTQEDADTLKWFPHVRQGILRGLEAQRTHNARDFVGLCIVVEKIYSHEIDTTVRACETFGDMFVSSYLAHRAVPVDV